MKRTPLALLCAATLTLLPTLSQAELSFNLGAVSLYKSNGLDQDNPKNKNFRPAIQGGVDQVFENGLYLGNWNSTGKFGRADLEIDLYGGYRGQIGELLSYDLGLITFIYPDSGGGWNGSEAYGSLSYGPITVKYARGVGGAIKKFDRLSLAYNHAFNEQWSLQAVVGTRNSEAGGFDDYSLGLTRDLGHGLTAGMAFSGATKKAQLGGAGDNRLVFSLIKGF